VALLATLLRWSVVVALLVGLLLGSSSEGRFLASRGSLPILRPQMNQRCYCGALKHEPRVHTCGFVWPEVFLILKNRRLVERRTLAAWGVAPRPSTATATAA
jgi:hypothetical protein